jgi:hypothetical protein
MTMEIASRTLKAALSSSLSPSSERTPATGPSQACVACSFDLSGHAGILFIVLERAQGMVEPGDSLAATLKKEFGEEALNTLDLTPAQVCCSTPFRTCMTNTSMLATDIPLAGRSASETRSALFQGL